MVKALVLSEAMQTNCLAKRKMSYLAQNSSNLSKQLCIYLCISLLFTDYHELSLNGCNFCN